MVWRPAARSSSPAETSSHPGSPEKRRSADSTVIDRTLRDPTRTVNLFARRRSRRRLGRRRAGRATERCRVLPELDPPAPSSRPPTT